MKTIFNSHAAFYSLCASAFLISGCESNSVNGYFANMPATSSASTQGTTSTSPSSPTSQPTLLPTLLPTIIPTSTPVVTITPTSTPSPIPTGTATATPSPTPSPTPVPVNTPSSTPTVTPVVTPTVTATPTVVASPSPTQTPVALPSTFVPNGILNGHFDVDTATGNLPFPTGSGNVTYHVHEYDKLNQTTTVDFFNLIDEGGSNENGNEFDQVQNTISKSKRFYLVVVNAGLNPGGVLELNGSVLRVTDYQNLTQQLLTGGVRPAAYTIGTPKTAGDIQLKSLKIGFDSNVTADALLVPTAPTNCVFLNIAGKFGEYRDGALVVQAIDASTIELNASTGASASNGGLLWEGIIYNHFETYSSSGKEVDPEICY